MKVVLIGSNGLLSNAIGKYCNKKHYDLIVYGLEAPKNHKYNEFIHVDLINDNLKFIDSILDFDVIFYVCGAGIQSNKSESADLIYKLNTFIPIGIFNLLQCNKYKGVFVTFGSYFEIGCNDTDKLFTELDVITSCSDVPNDYCVSKRLLTRFLSSKSESINFIHSILPTIYGEEESTHRIIPYTINSIKENCAVEYTSGSQIRQYIYINDVPSILFRLIEVKYSGVLNINGTETFSIMDLVKKIFSLFGLKCDSSAFGTAKRQDVSMQNLQLDGQKLHFLIGDFKRTKLEDVIRLY